MRADEFQGLKDALNRVDMSIPIKRFADEDYTKEEIQELYRILSERIDIDPSVLKDDAWMQEWDDVQRLAGHYGVC